MLQKNPCKIVFQSNGLDTNLLTILQSRGRFFVGKMSRTVRDRIVGGIHSVVTIARSQLCKPVNDVNPVRIIKFAGTIDLLIHLITRPRTDGIKHTQRTIEAIEKITVNDATRARTRRRTSTGEINFNRPFVR